MTATPEDAEGVLASGPLSLHVSAPGVARRRLLQLAGGSVLGGVLSACATRTPAGRSAAATAAPSPAGSSAAPRVDATTVAPAAFVDGTLPIPPLLVPEVRGGTKVFRLTLRQGLSRFVPGQATTTFGFNGSYLGPTLRARRNDRVQIHATNRLGEPTTVHWHGMHLPASMDGGPLQPIASGGTWGPSFTISQPAATLWYHPHLMGATLRQVGRGAAGLFILDDDDPAGDSLPSTYGVDDIPLILQAQTFTADGQFALNGGGRGGRGGGAGGGGARTLVNGVTSPVINTPAPRLRLRLLNASTQGIFTIGFAGGQTFHQVASDGGLLRAPVSLTTLRLAPAERAEIVFEVDPARPLVLQSLGGGGGGGGGGTNTPAGPLLTIRSTGKTASAAVLPAALAVIPRLSPGSAAQTRNLVLGGNNGNPTINGRAMTTISELRDMTDVLRVKLGSVEIWNVVNRSDDPHAFHVHDIQFQILQRNGSAPAANESGLKDTVVVRGGRRCASSCASPISPTRRRPTCTTAIC